VFAIDSLRVSYWFCASFVLEFAKMAEASSIDSSHTFSLSIEELITMRDLMEKMYDINIALEEQLMAMKQEE
jgi:hypothetical protein